MMGNYYDILGISPTASSDEIKKAYRKLSLKFHPDKNDGDEYFSQMFRQVNDAYNILIDPEKRRFYDFKLREQMNAKNSAERLKKLEEELVRKEQMLRRQSAHRTYQPPQPVYNKEPARSKPREFSIKIQHVKYFLWVVIIWFVYAIGSSGEKEKTPVREKSTYVKPKSKPEKKKKQKTKVETPVIDTSELIPQTVTEIDRPETRKNTDTEINEENTNIEVNDAQLIVPSDTTEYH